MVAHALVGIGNPQDRWYLPHCSENEFVESEAEEGG